MDDITNNGVPASDMPVEPTAPEAEPMMTPDAPAPEEAPVEGGEETPAV